MISVTIAAQGKQKRLFGGQLKAYDSKRVSVSDLEKTIESEKTKKRWKIVILFTKIINAILHLFRLHSHFGINEKSEEKKGMSNKVQPKSIVEKLNDEVLLIVFQHLNSRNLLNCKLVCFKWNQFITQNAFELVRWNTDQIRILFDQGELLIYPVDEKKYPLRHPLPSLQVLRKLLVHLTTQSLFIRGLIPVESGSVLRLLLTLDLQPQQIYFIWSKFSLESVYLFEKLIEKNSNTVTDIGLEEFSPSHLITDQTVLPVVKQLTSLRLWNSGDSTHYGVTDETILGIARTLLDGSNIETIDLGTCFISTESVVLLIRNWEKAAENDLTVMLSNCRPVNRFDIIEQLLEYGIQLRKNRHLHSRSHMLTLIC